ncbi:GHKL domain-containing protein [Faecalimicrobium sp. JNUCC 81]
MYWFCVYIPIEYISLDLAFIINFNDLTKDYYINPNKVELESMIIQFVFMLSSLYTFIYAQNFYKFKKISDIFICIPVIINILTLIVAFRLIAIDRIFFKVDILILVCMPVLILISNIYFLNMMKKIIKGYKVEHENKTLKENIFKEYNYYLNINKEKDKVKSLYHDTKNHMICIRHLCKTNDTEKIIEYIDSMKTNIIKYNKYKEEFNTGNMILDSILINKKSICVEKQIDFDINIDFSKNDFMDMMDVCTIFSNLIDNAIEACDKINKSNINKKIKLESKYIDQFCIILIENTKINEIKIRKNLFITSKKNSYIHGIGLNNIKSSVEKYLGEMVINHSENKFIVKIMIPCKG